MKQTCKIVLIGAGSREFSKGLIHDLVLHTQLLNQVSVTCVLVDTHAGRLHEVLAYAQSCIELTQTPLQVQATMDRREALAGADFVLISIATHRMDLWEQDFRIPIAYGFKQIYGENGGPGALFHALRNLHLVMPICRDIEELAPDALVLNFTNPEARILTGILKLTGLSAYGLCHGFHDFYSFASRILQRPVKELDLRTAGMNHFITFYTIADKGSGEDLIPEFMRRVEESRELLPPLVRFLFETFGVFGLDSDRHIGEYVSYAHELSGIKWEFGIENREVLQDYDYITNDMAFDAWRNRTDIRGYMTTVYQPNPNSVAPADRSRIIPSGELAVPIIAAMTLDNRRWVPSVNVLNTDGYIENLSNSGCIEVPAWVDHSGIYPEHAGSLPEGFAAMIRTQHAIQALLIDAYASGSKALLYQALLLDPVVDSPTQAEKMLDDMLYLQRSYLPEFR